MLALYLSQKSNTAIPIEHLLLESKEIICRERVKIICLVILENLCLVMI